MSMMAHKAVFLDRDGVICRQVDHLRRVQDLKLLPKVDRAIRLLNSSGYKVVIVTNQSAIWRDYLSEQELSEIHNKLMNRLERHGAQVDAIYYCPHGPDENCSCRKPESGMLYAASEKLNIDLQKSFIIGDKYSDLKAGENAQCKTILVLTGHGREEKKGVPKWDFKPDFIASNLYSAVSWILKINVTEDVEDGERDCSYP